MAQIVGEKSAHQMAFGTVPGGPLQPHSRAQNLGSFLWQGLGTSPRYPRFVLKVSEESIGDLRTGNDRQLCWCFKLLI